MVDFLVSISGKFDKIPSLISLILQQRTSVECGECELFVWGRIHGEVPTHSTWALTVLMDESGGVEAEGSGKYPEMSNLAVVGT